MPTATSARDLVQQRLAQQCRVFPDLSLTALSHDDADARGLDARDVGLAIAIEQSVLRYWNSLVAALQLHLSRPWENVETKLQAVLLSGAAQLLLLDRVPDHAAIDESVNWAKAHIRPKAGGLVNAVLRKVSALRGERVDAFDQASRRQLPLPDGGALTLLDDVFAADPLERLAQQTSHPIELLQQWQGHYGRVETINLALHSLVHAPIIVIIAADAAPTFDDVLTPHIDANCFVFTGNRAQLTELLHAVPSARVQDPSSAAPVRRTGNLSPNVIIDYCAGLGTKTRQLADLHRDAQIIATDVNDERRAALHRQFDDHERIEVVEPADITSHAGRADLLLLDVPCSNTGVLARRVEAKHRWSAVSQRKLIDLQRQIIADTLPLLADSGHLLYATCSIDPAENRQQIEWLIRWHDFNVTDEHDCVPAGLPGEPPTVYRDGSFAAALRR